MSENTSGEITDCRPSGPIVSSQARRFARFTAQPSAVSSTPAPSGYSSSTAQAVHRRIRPRRTGPGPVRHGDASRTQYAPREASTARTVRARISRSRVKDQLST